MLKPDSLPDAKWSKFEALCAAYGVSPDEKVTACILDILRVPLSRDAKGNVFLACPKGCWFAAGDIRYKLDKLSLPSIYTALRVLRQEGMVEVEACDGKKFLYRLSPKGLAVHNCLTSEG